MFEAMSEGVMQLRAILDEKGNTIDFIYLDLNPAWERFIGDTRGNRIGHRASEFYEQIPFLDEFGQVATTGIPVSFEAFQPYVKKWVHISALSIEPGVVTVIFSDITERRRAQQVLEDAYVVMEERVRERTRQLEASSASRQKLLQQLVSTQEDERRRITRELHDQLGQYITAIDVGLKVLRDKETDDAEFYWRIDQLQELTRQTGAAVQSLAYELRPSSIDDLGLTRTLENYLESWSAQTGIQAYYQDAGLENRRLAPSIEITLYRIIQEALTNVVRHSSAKFVSIIIESTPHHLLAIVEDNGKGFDVSTVLDGHNERASLGLIGMRERAEMLGGTLEIESIPGTSTTVYVRIPLEDSNTNP
jgi:signal transduction histidine kinase